MALTSIVLTVTTPPPTTVVVEVVTLPSAPAPTIADGSLSIAQTSGLQAALDGKATTAQGAKADSALQSIADGSLSIAKTSGLQAALDGKAAANLIYGGNNPNIPENLTISGYTVPGDAPVTLVRGITVMGYPTWSDLAGWWADHQYPVWGIYLNGVLKFTNDSSALTPVGLTGWTLPGGGAQPVFTGDNPIGTQVGQLCKSASGWWKWTGTAWESLGDEIHNLTAKTEIVDADEAVISDSGDDYAPKKVSFASIWTWIVSKATATFSAGGLVKWAASLDAMLTNFGFGATGKLLAGAATSAAAREALDIQGKIGTSTGLSAVGTADITGLTGYTLEADTWYKLELNYLFTSTSSNFGINFVTTGTFRRGGTTPYLGQAMSAIVVLEAAYFLSDTSFRLRGSVNENRTNVPMVGWAMFKTGTAGTGKVQLQLLSGTTLSTITSACCVLTKQG